MTSVAASVLDGKISLKQQRCSFCAFVQSRNLPLFTRIHGKDSVRPETASLVTSVLQTDADWSCQPQIASVSGRCRSHLISAAALRQNNQECGGGGDLMAFKPKVSINSPQHQKSLLLVLRIATLCSLPVSSLPPAAFCVGFHSSVTTEKNSSEPWRKFQTPRFDLPVELRDSSAALVWITRSSSPQFLGLTAVGELRVQSRSASSAPPRAKTSPGSS